MSGLPNILLVDDEPANLILLINVLEQEYELQIAKTGYQALDLATEDPVPDLILLDIQLPDIDGFEVLKKLRDNEKTINVPVIFVTSRTGAKDEQLGLESGGDDYITKPINPTIVSARIKTQLDNKKERDAIKSQNALIERDLLYSQKVGKIGSWKFDLDNKTVAGTTEFYRLYGIEDNKVGLPLTFDALISYIYISDRERFKVAWDDAENGKIYHIEYRTHLSGGNKWLMSIGEVEYDGDVPINSYGIIQDVTHKKEYEQRLEKIAYNDPLTGLPNRYSTENWIEAHNTSTISNCVLYAIDLDDLSKINSSMGVSIGDEILLVISKRLLAFQDDNTLVAHFGGDKFMIVKEVDTSKFDVEGCAKEIQNVIGKVINTNGDELSITACVSSVEYVDTDISTGLLLRMSDYSLYLAKLREKNTYFKFDMSEYDTDVKINAKLTEIRNAFYDGQFLLYYQPKVSLETREILGFEALLRWNKPGAGIVGPYLIIPHIEDHPLMIEVGDFVLREAIGQLNTWKHNNFNTKVSVNVATNQYQHPEFLSKLLTCVDKHKNVSISDIELEILESGPLMDFDTSMTVFDNLRKVEGVFSLDDFGAGHSSLQTLHTFKPDYIKIDKSFVMGMLEDSDKYLITKAIIMLGNNFNLDVIAEGVELEEHWNELKMLGCKYGQGFGIGKPMPASKVMEWVERWNSGNMI